MKKIDVHVHMGKLFYRFPGVRVKDVLEMMDRLDVEKACIMANDNPEELDYYFTTDQVLRACRPHRDRLSPFCNVDPRHGDPPTYDPTPIIERYIERGCKGFGEVLCGLPIDDPRSMLLFATCEKLGLPVLLHIDKYRNTDDIGLPRFEKVLQAFPKAIFIAHAVHWWSEISAGVKEEEKVEYPQGPVISGGRADLLLGRYDNLYADLSAKSGQNALTRDPAFAVDFVTRHQDKLLYGSDYFYRGQVTENHIAIEQLSVDEEVKKKVFYTNAKKVLRI